MSAGEVMELVEVDMIGLKRDRIAARCRVRRVAYCTKAANRSTEGAEVKRIERLNVEVEVEA
jgi:hypothetical protein